MNSINLIVIELYRCGLSNSYSVSCDRSYISRNQPVSSMLWNLCVSYLSVQFSLSVVSGSSQPNESQHARPPCPSPTPGVYSDTRPSSWWCHPVISFSVIPFSSQLHSFPSSGSFQMSQFFASGGQSIGVSASVSVFQMNIQDWSPLGWTGWISLPSKGLSRFFSNTTVQKHLWPLKVKILWRLADRKSVV